MSGWLCHGAPGLRIGCSPVDEALALKALGQRESITAERPSILQVSADKKDGKVTATKIGGRCVPMMSGMIDLG